jgi:hypothetical protein
MTDEARIREEIKRKLRERVVTTLPETALEPLRENESPSAVFNRTKERFVSL